MKPKIVRPKILDVKTFQDNGILPCNCMALVLVDKVLQHIVTVVLRFARNNKLRKLFAKGFKYKETNNNSREKAKSTMDGLNDSIDPFVPNATLLYPLKISENPRFSEVFR